MGLRYGHKLLLKTALQRTLLNDSHSRTLSDTKAAFFPLSLETWSNHLPSKREREREGGRQRRKASAAGSPLQGSMKGKLEKGTISWFHPPTDNWCVIISQPHNSGRTSENDRGHFSHYKNCRGFFPGRNGRIFIYRSNQRMWSGTPNDQDLSLQSVVPVAACSYHPPPPPPSP